MVNVVRCVTVDVSSDTMIFDWSMAAGRGETRIGAKGGSGVVVWMLAGRGGTGGKYSDEGGDWRLREGRRVLRLGCVMGTTAGARGAGGASVGASGIGGGGRVGRERERVSEELLSGRSGLDLDVESREAGRSVGSVGLSSSVLRGRSAPKSS